MTPSTPPYELAFLSSRVLGRDGSPPPDLILGQNITEARRGGRSKEENASELIFVEYKPSALELNWSANVRAWQSKVCLHTSDAQIAAWLGAVKHAWLEPRRTLYTSATPAVPAQLLATQLSAFTYRATYAASRDVEYVHVAIEPTASIARDPRKCWEPRTWRYTQSKEHLLPLTHAAAYRTRPATPSSSRGARPRAILFDAGATIPLIAGEQGREATGATLGGTAGGKETRQWSGTAWLYKWYKARGITFERVYAWEPRRQAVDFAALEPGFAKALVFHNRGCVGKEGHPDNPLTVIARECRPEDLCVLKLDIDSEKHELLINSQLLGSPPLMALVDEYYFEHHVQNSVMAAQGLGHRPRPGVNDLESWYQMVTAARQRGLRMHFWP